MSNREAWDMVEAWLVENGLHLAPHRLAGTTKHEELANRMTARLRAAEAERDKYARLHSEAEAQIECRNELRYRLRESEAALAQVRAQVDTMIATHDEVEKRAEQAERERDQARERESYALAAIARNDERHAEAIRAVRQRAERAEQTRDAHAEALSQAAREAGDLLDRIAALVVERDEARAALIRSQEDHRAAVEALETYEERIGDIADHVLGLVPPDVPSIVKLDAIERRCGEERVAARQAERQRDEARAAAAREQQLHRDSADRWLVKAGRLRAERQEWEQRADGYGAMATEQERRAEAAEARWSAEQATALEALRQAEAAEARVAELEAEQTKLRVDHASWYLDQKRLAVLERIADAAREALDRHDRTWPRHSDAPDVAKLRAALAARGKDGG